MERRDLLNKEFIKRFEHSPELFVQAPGRVDLLGSHTDYNEGFVLTQAIDRNTWIALRPRSDGHIRICSLNVDGCGEFGLENISHDTVSPWTNYVRGVADVMRREGYPLRGFNGLVHSTIPFGSGLSSSAALEVATAVALMSVSDLEIDPVKVAKMCQRAENEFVGLNCGILDQYSSALGASNNALLLDCRTITHVTRPIPNGLRVVICDTRSERALTGSEYPERRAQCERGAHILSGFYPTIRTLRDATLAQLEAHQDDMEPVVYKRCKFIIEENRRVLDMAEALGRNDQDAIGRLAMTSYEGARDLYEIVSKEMAAMYDAMMSAPGVLGARGAGAGFGGCMVAFVRKEDVPAFIQHARGRYHDLTDITPDIYTVNAAEGAGEIIV